INSDISVFHSAIATFFAPSDVSGSHGMWCECIHSTPSWCGREVRHDCAFIMEDETKEGFMGMAIVRVKLFFSLVYDDISYPCALVKWFRKVGCDPVTGMWVVWPDTTCGRQDKSVMHLDAFLQAAHLIPVYGKELLPLNFHYSYSLDTFEAYYVNKYIDNDANKIVT
ncbi:hypothetical protein EI94DRAFT_1619300, partial [Lactarius quietus]